jgi:hypothetical protein
VRYLLPDVPAHQCDSARTANVASSALPTLTGGGRPNNFSACRLGTFAARTLPTDHIQAAQMASREGLCGRRLVRTCGRQASRNRPRAARPLDLAAD